MIPFNYTVPGAIAVSILLLGTVGSAVYFLSGLFGQRDMNERLNQVCNDEGPEEYDDQEFPSPPAPFLSEAEEEAEESQTVFHFVRE